MLLIIIALLFIFPGIYAYLSGRKYLAMDHTKAFALHYFKYQQQAGLIFWLCFLVSSVLLSLLRRENMLIGGILDRTGGLAFAVFFILAYSLFIVGFSAIQGAVRDEHVPVLDRIAFNLLHLLLILWPYLFLVFAATNSPNVHPVHTVLIVIAYATMYVFSFGLWKILMKARHVSDEDLTSWRKRTVEATGMPAIPLLVFPAAGLKFANAFFVGNYGTRKGIFISRYAFDNLSGDELLAIYAHEIGHGQPHQVIRRSFALVLPFAALMAFNILVPSAHIFIQFLCLIGALVIMKLLIPSQKFEREADLFALTTTGNADAVISGLEKIYNLGILPERFAPSEEKRLSHPSLVKRKIYIQEAAGRSATSMPEPVEFPLADSAGRIRFENDGFSILHPDKEPLHHAYTEVTSMYPKTEKEYTELTIRYTNAKEKFKLAAAYDVVAPVIDAIMPRFSLKPYIDPGRYKRSYYLWMIITTFFGLAFSFFVGPALLFLGIAGLVKRRKGMLMSIGIANVLYFLYPYIIRTDSVGGLNKGYSIAFGMIGVICLFDYLGIRRFEEPEHGKGGVNFGFSVFFGLIALGAVLALGIGRLWGQDPYAVSGAYSVLFYNAIVLSIGLVISCRMREIRRRAVLFIGILLYAIFALIHLTS